MHRRRCPPGAARATRSTDWRIARDAIHRHGVPLFVTEAASSGRGAVPARRRRADAADEAARRAGRRVFVGDPDAFEKAVTAWLTDRG